MKLSFDERLIALLCCAREQYLRNGFQSDDWTDVEVLQSLARFEPYVFLADDIFHEGYATYFLHQIYGRFITYTSGRDVVTILDDGWVDNPATEASLIDTTYPLLTVCFLRLHDGSFKAYRALAYARKCDIGPRGIALASWEVATCSDPSNWFGAWEGRGLLRARFFFMPGLNL